MPLPRPPVTQATERRPSRTQAQGRVLVLDESYPVRTALLEILTRLGVPEADVSVAETVEEALDLFRGTPPGVVFAELVGSGSDEGLDAIHAMLHLSPRTRVILLTAEPRDAPEVRAAIRAGVFAYVEKPVRQDKIRQVLQELENEAADIRRI